MISNALFYNIKNFDYKNEKKMYKVMCDFWRWKCINR